MRIILNSRHGARNVAIRLDVGIGNYDFTCDKQETAHYLEHLLFTGTSQHTEIELDELITRHGGDWNAYTYDESTVYELDIFSAHIDVALETLSEIISDSVITAENYDLSRTIIYREMGGKPSSIRQFLYKHEIVSTASHKSRKVILNGNRSYCSNLDTLKDLEFQDIIDAYKYFYVANNMTLVIT
ncbi:MAG: insulinase family protein, partial [Arenicellales bacterium]